MAKDSTCIVTDCPAWQRPTGCGFLAAGTPCGNPKMRERWRAAQGPEPQPACPSVIRRAEAAQRPLSPARALQLAMQLEVEG